MTSAALKMVSGSPAPRRSRFSPPNVAAPVRAGGTTPTPRSTPVKVAVELEWDGDAEALRRLRLPDGSLLTLNDQQFYELRESIHAADLSSRKAVVAEGRYKAHSPEKFGLALGALNFHADRPCWVNPETPNAGIVSYNSRDETWNLTVVELGVDALKFPVASAAWNDPTGIADLCAMTSDPAGTQLLASLMYPAEIGEHAVALTAQRQWDDLKATTEMQMSLPKARARKHTNSASDFGAYLKFSGVAVERAALGITLKKNLLPEEIIVGVQVHSLWKVSPQAEELRIGRLSWLRDAMEGGRIALHVVEHEDKVYVTRNPQFLRNCLSLGVLRHL